MANKTEYCTVDISWSPPIDSEYSQSALVVFRVDDEQDSEGACSATPKGMTFQPKCKDSNIPGDEEHLVESLTITITCRNPPYHVKISAIDVICEAKHLEIFSGTGEYIDTCRGIRIDEEIGHSRKLFMMQHSFETVQHSASIKLLSLLEKTECFIHSLYVTVCPSSRYPQSDMVATPLGGPTIDLEKVKSLLPDSGDEMSGNAKSLLENMEMYQKNQNANREAMARMVGGILPGCGNNPSMAAMMSMFAGMAGGATAMGNNLSQDPNDLSAASSKEQEVKNGSHVVEVKSEAPPADAANKDSTNKNSAPSEDNLHEMFSKSENVTLALNVLEQKFLGHMKEFEARMAEFVEMQIKLSEDRIMSKLDDVIKLMKV